MRIYLLSILSLLFAATLVSCNSFERDAESQLSQSAKALSSKGKTEYGIEEKKIVYSTDSVVVIDFIATENDTDGTIEKAKMEYIYCKGNDGKLYECFSFLDEEKSILDVSDEVFREEGVSRNGMTDEELKAHTIYACCGMKAILYGQEVTARSNGK